MTVPNALTVLRLVLVPVFVCLVVSGRHWLGLAVFVTAGVTDALDGWIARRFHQHTAIGTFLDPIADKVMMVSAFLVLALHPGPARLPLWFPLLVLGWHLVLLAVGLVVLARTGRREFSPTRLGKLTIVVQIALAVVALIDSARGERSALLSPLLVATAALSSVCAIHYLTIAAGELRRVRPA